MEWLVEESFMYCYNFGDDFIFLNTIYLFASVV